MAGGTLTDSRDVLRKAPVLLEIRAAAPSSSKWKSAESAGTEHIHRLI